MQPELIALMRIPKMSRIRARALFQNGITTAEQLSTASVADVVIVFLLNQTSLTLYLLEG
jgi:hypothetical protein